MVFLSFLMWFQILTSGPTGALVIEHPDSVAVVVIGAFQKSITSGDTLNLPAGDFQLRFGFPGYRDLLADVTIRADHVQRLVLVPKAIRTQRDRELHSIVPMLVWNANLIVETDSKSRLVLNHVALDTTVAVMSVEPGTYTLESIDANGKRRVKRISVSTTRLSYADMSAPQSKQRLHQSAYVPGLSQYHRNELIKSTLFAGSFSTIAVYAVLETRNAGQIHARYQSTRKSYASVLSPLDLEILAARGARQADELTTARRNRNIAWSALSAVYVWNIWDGRRAGSAGYRTDAPRVQPFVAPGAAGLRLRL
jgi:hypothetical protein